MRIAVVTTSYPAYEGDPAGHFVEAEVKALQQAGEDVRVIRPEPGGAFGWPGAPARIRERPSRLIGATWWMGRAAVELRHFRPDRIIAHWCVPSAVPIVLTGSMRQASELEIVSHGGDIRLLRQMPLRMRERVFDAALARTTRWRFVSAELRASLDEVLDQERRRALDRVAFIAASPVEVPDVREDARAKRSTIAGRRLYVCAGRLVPSKRVDKVIDYVATTPTSIRTPDDRVLVVLGDGPEREHLERVAKAWRLDVRFLGKTTRRETLGWIGAADELVHASRVEGLSTVVREASLLGVPVTILS